MEAHEEAYAEADWTHYFASRGIEDSKRAAGNPVHAWRAYLECRSHHLPIPEWVLSYLDRVAARVWVLSSAGRTPPNDVSVAIAEALEMKRPGRSGAGNVFAHYDQTDQIMLAMEVAQQIEFLDGQHKLAYKRVAKKHHVSSSKVERAFNVFRKDLEADGVFRIKK